MAESKKADAGQAEVQDAFTEAQKKGFFGESPSPIPNKEYSLESGPESPSAFEGQVAHVKARLKTLEEGAK
jgi:hypothetical protein